jgi:hypothetical protein
LVHGGMFVGDLRFARVMIPVVRGPLMAVPDRATKKFHDF